MARLRIAGALLSACFEKEYRRRNFSSGLACVRPIGPMHPGWGGQTISAESVIQVQWRYLKDAAYNSGNVFGANTRGEAVIIELGNGRGLLFALLGNLYEADGSTFITADTPIHALSGYRNQAEFFRSTGNNDSRWQAILSSAVNTKEVALTREQLPSFVHFADVADPTTAHHVLPSDFQKQFGAGVTLKRVTVRITDEPVTERIRSALPWVSELDKRPLSMKPRSERTAYELLTESHLRQGP